MAQTPEYVEDTAVQADLQTARSGADFVKPEHRLLGFWNRKPYTNACYRNAILTLLLNIVPFVGWVNILNTKGFLPDTDSVPDLLWQLTRTYWQESPGVKTKAQQTKAQKTVNQAVNALHKKVFETWGQPGAQEDSLEFLEHVIEKCLGSMRSADQDGEALVNALLRTRVVPYYTCKACHNESRAPPDAWLNVFSLTAVMTPNVRTFDQLVRTSLVGNSTNPGPMNCAECNKKLGEFTGAFKILNPSEILLIDVPQLDMSTAGTFGVQKFNINLPDISDVLDLTEYLEPDTLRHCDSLRYRYAGAVHHSDELGHYVSHVKHSDDTWRICDDMSIVQGNDVNIQGYKLTADFFPRVLAFVRIPGADTLGSPGPSIREVSVIPEIPKIAEISETPGIPEIEVCQTTDAKDLLAHCRSHGIAVGRVKKADKLQSLLDAAILKQDDYTLRSKEWLMKTLDGFGQSYKNSATKTDLVGQLTQFLNSRKSKVDASQEQVASRQSTPRSRASPGIGRQAPPADGQTLATGSPFSPRSFPPIRISRADDGEQQARQSQLLADYVAMLIEKDHRIRDCEETLAGQDRRIAEQDQYIAMQDRRIAGLTQMNANLLMQIQPPANINTDYVRMLARQLRPSTPKRSRKRGAEDAAEESPETKKAKLLQHADGICALIDSGEPFDTDPGPLEYYREAEAHERSNSNEENQPPHQRGNSDEENQPPRGPIRTPPNARGTTQMTCHRCPQWPTLVHHMHDVACCGQPADSSKSPEIVILEPGLWFKKEGSAETDYWMDPNCQAAKASDEEWRDSPTPNYKEPPAYVEPEEREELADYLEVPDDYEDTLAFLDTPDSPDYP